MHTIVSLALGSMGQSLVFAALAFPSSLELRTRCIVCRVVLARRLAHNHSSSEGFVRKSTDRGSNIMNIGTYASVSRASGKGTCT